MIIMKPILRRKFDRLLNQVIDELPAEYKKLLNEIPLVVDDNPDEEIMGDLGVSESTELCGLYTGIPLTEKSVRHSGILPDQIRIFRAGVLRAASDAAGWVDDDALLEQIRITVLHEMGHHFGLDEDDLRRLGYH